MSNLIPTVVLVVVVVVVVTVVVVVVIATVVIAMRVRVGLMAGIILIAGNNWRPRRRTGGIYLFGM